MRRTGATSVFLPPAMCAVLLVPLAVTGCNNTCVFFTSNPPMGKLEIKSTCTLTTGKGTLQVEISRSAMTSPTLGPSAIQHIFMSLRGIDAHPSTNADDDSPEWQELAPHLALQPVQVDLMARPGPDATGALGESEVPAGVYRQIRLHLVPNQPATGEPVPEVNACGSAASNCIVRADGSIQPFKLDGRAPGLRIAPDRIAGGSILVLPDTENALTIEFNASLSVVLPTGDAIRLFPVLTAARPAEAESLQAQRSTLK